MLHNIYYHVQGKTIWINYSNYYLGSNCLYAYYRDFRIEINWDHPFNNYCRAFLLGQWVSAQEDRKKKHAENESKDLKL